MFRQILSSETVYRRYMKCVNVVRVPNWICVCNNLTLTFTFKRVVTMRLVKIKS